MPGRGLETGSPTGGRPPAADGERATAPDLEARWSAAWAAVASGEPRSVFTAVVAAYREPHRAYHDLGHLRHCLDELDTAADVAERRDEVELALWFHDVVYKPLSSQNEDASARYASRALRAAGADGEVAARIAAMVLATRHRDPPATPDERLVVDVDLAILAAEPAAFERYEAGIRREFSWVPGEAFRRRRAEVLRRFLERGHLYSTDRFRERYEARARANLRRSLARLGH